MSSKTNKARRDEWTAQQIAKAVKFTASMFIGLPSRYDTREAETLAEARTIARDMLEAYAGTNYGRGVMLYAITPTNMTIHVENLYPEKKA